MVTERITTVCNDAQGIWSYLWFSVLVKGEYNRRLILNLLISRVKPSKMSTVGEGGNARREENPGYEELCGHTEERHGKGAPQRGSVLMFPCPGESTGCLTKTALQMQGTCLTCPFLCPCNYLLTLLKHFPHFTHRGYKLAWVDVG